jgi:hypothetical protein
MSIRLSEEHGVNPAIPKCFFCMKDKNELILAGRLRDDAEAPRNMVWDMGPCDECDALMSQGVLMISVADGEMEKEDRKLELARADFEREYGYKSESWKRKNFNHMPNPYRTGGWVVVRDRVITDMVQPEELAQQILDARWTFVPDEVWDLLGLPRDEEIDNRNSEA